MGGEGGRRWGRERVPIFAVGGKVWAEGGRPEGGDIMVEDAQELRDVWRTAYATTRTCEECRDRGPLTYARLVERGGTATLDPLSDLEDFCYFPFRQHGQSSYTIHCSYSSFYPFTFAFPPLS